MQYDLNIQQDTAQEYFIIIETKDRAIAALNHLLKDEKQTFQVKLDQALRKKDFDKEDIRVRANESKKMNDMLMNENDK